jgi:hypothetical protein
MMASQSFNELYINIEGRLKIVKIFEAAASKIREAKFWGGGMPLAGGGVQAGRGRKRGAGVPRDRADLQFFNAALGR